MKGSSNAQECPYCGKRKVDTKNHTEDQGQQVCCCDETRITPADSAKSSSRSRQSSLLILMSVIVLALVASLVIRSNYIAPTADQPVRPETMASDQPKRDNLEPGNSYEISEPKFYIEGDFGPDVGWVVTGNSKVLTDADFKELPKDYRLKRKGFVEILSLRECKVNGTGLSDLSRLRISSLDLSSCPVTESGLITAIKTNGLSSIALNGCALSHTSYARLADCPTLSGLRLSGSQITKEVMQTISRIKTLRSLWITHTDLSKEIADEIIHLPKLSSLCLMESTVQQGSLKALEHSKTLVGISFRQMDITNALIEEISYLPRKRVQFFRSRNLATNWDQLRDTSMHLTFLGCKNISMKDVETLIDSKVRIEGLPQKPVGEHP